MPPNSRLRAEAPRTPTHKKPADPLALPLVGSRSPPAPPPLPLPLAPEGGVEITPKRWARPTTSPEDENGRRRWAASPPPLADPPPLAEGSGIDHRRFWNAALAQLGAGSAASPRSGTPPMTEKRCHTATTQSPAPAGQTLVGRRPEAHRRLLWPSSGGSGRLAGGRGNPASSTIAVGTQDVAPTSGLTLGYPQGGTTILPRVLQTHPLCRSRVCVWRRPPDIEFSKNGPLRSTLAPQEARPSLEQDVVVPCAAPHWSSGRAHFLCSCRSAFHAF